MSDKPLSPLLNESSQASSSRQLWTSHYLIPVGILIAVVLLAILVFTQPFSWFHHQTKPQDTTTLKNQITLLNNRIDQLETSSQLKDASSINPERLNAIESRISTIYQQVEVLMNQPKVEVSPQQIERSQLLEKDLSQLADTQKNIKSLIFFWRLKIMVMSNEPYRKELNDFKSVSSTSVNLTELEKHADQGIKALSQLPDHSNFPFLSDPSASWLDRLKALVGSFIKIEKVGPSGTSIPTSQQERQKIEENLEQIEQNLIQPLLSPLPAPSPQSGDPL